MSENLKHNEIDVETKLGSVRLSFISETEVFARTVDSNTLNVRGIEHRACLHYALLPEDKSRLLSAGWREKDYSRFGVSRKAGMQDATSAARRTVVDAILAQILAVYAGRPELVKAGGLDARLRVLVRAQKELREARDKVRELAENETEAMEALDAHTPQWQSRLAELEAEGGVL